MLEQKRPISCTIRNVNNIEIREKKKRTKRFSLYRIWVKRAEAKRRFEKKITHRIIWHLNQMIIFFCSVLRRCTCLTHTCDAHQQMLDNIACVCVCERAERLARFPQQWILCYLFFSYRVDRVLIAYSCIGLRAESTISGECQSFAGQIIHFRIYVCSCSLHNSLF